MRTWLALIVALLAALGCAQKAEGNKEVTAELPFQFAMVAEDSDLGTTTPEVSLPKGLSRGLANPKSSLALVDVDFIPDIFSLPNRDVETAIASGSIRLEDSEDSRDHVFSDVEARISRGGKAQKVTLFVKVPSPIYKKIIRYIAGHPSLMPLSDGAVGETLLRD